MIDADKSAEETTALKQEFNKVAEPNDLISPLKEIYADILNDSD